MVNLGHWKKITGIALFLIVTFILISTFFVTDAEESNTSLKYTDYTLFPYNNTLLKGNKLWQISFDPAISMIFNPVNDCIYAAGGNNITVINSTTNHVQRFINVYPPGSTPILFYEPVSRNILVINVYNNNSIVVLNGSTNKVVKIINNIFIYGGTYESADNDFYMISWNGIILFNATTNSIIHGKYLIVSQMITIPIYDPYNKDIYIFNDTGAYAGIYYPLNYTPKSEWNHTIEIYSGITNRRIGSINVGYSPLGMAFDPVNNYIYILNEKSNNITIVNGNTNKVVGNIDVSFAPRGIVFDPLNNYILVSYLGIKYPGYALHGMNTNITIINAQTNTVIGNASVSYEPGAMVYDPANGEIYIGTPGSISIVSFPAQTNQPFNYLWLILPAVLLIAVTVLIIVLQFRKNSKN